MEEHTNKKISPDIEERYPIKLWMLFEVQAVQEKIAIQAMKDHISKLSKEEGVVMKKYLIEDPEKIEAPDSLKNKNVHYLYSVLAEVVIHVVDISSAFKVVMNYAPSSLEVLSPKKYEISMRDMQDMLASLADFLHKVLSYSVGGVVLKL